MRSARRLLLALLCAAAALPGCGATPTPEDEVRATLAALEAAAEAGDASAFTALVSADYSDPYGHDRDKLRAFVAFHVLRSGRGREVILRVRDVHIEASEPTRAAVTLAVGLGAGSRRRAGGLGAEVYAVDLDLAREGDAWRVAWAQWHAAPATDLL